MKVNFFKIEICWKTYTSIKAFLKTKQIKLIIKKKFVVAVLDLKKRTYIINMASFIYFNSHIYLFLVALIKILWSNSVLTIVLYKYINFVDIILIDLATQFVEYTRIHNQIMTSLENSSPFYRFIHRLRLTELEMLKIYIEIYYQTNF